MNEAKALRLIEVVKDGRVISTRRVETLDVEEVLSLRECREFDREWVRARMSVRELPSGDPDEKVRLELRERAFRKTYNATDSGDLSGYVSKDFDLFADYLLAGKEDAWLSGLLAEYLGGGIPHGSIESSPRTLVELMDEFLTEHGCK